MRLNLSSAEYEQLLDGFHAFSDIGAKTECLSDAVSQQLYVITAGQVWKGMDRYIYCPTYSTVVYTDLDQPPAIIRVLEHYRPYIRSKWHTY